MLKNRGHFIEPDLQLHMRGSSPKKFEIIHWFSYTASFTKLVWTLIQLNVSAGKHVSLKFDHIH